MCGCGLLSVPGDSIHSSSRLKNASFFIKVDSNEVGDLQEGCLATVDVVREVDGVGDICEARLWNINGLSVQIEGPGDEVVKHIQLKCGHGKEMSGQ